MVDQLPITIRGKKLLEAELKELLQVERPKIVKAIEEAREQGDLSENVDYDAAKERQGFIEARISEIQGRIAGAEVVDPKTLKSDKVIFGATVALKDLDEDKEIIYQITGPEESDVKEGRISILSPLARTLIGKKVKDIVELSTNNFTKEYKVLSIKFK